MRKSKLKKINAVILGSGGYTGSELVNILSKHPYVKIQNFGSERVLTGKGKNINDKLSLIDVVFCCFVWLGLLHFCGLQQQLVVGAFGNFYRYERLLLFFIFLNLGIERDHQKNTRG